MKVLVSVGELIDKLTILEIKLNKISDPHKKINIEKEYTEIVSQHGNFRDLDLYKELYNVNIALWEIEDLIRLKEKNKQFDQEFIELSRSVYLTNDKRFAIKSAINDLFNSAIREEKSYEKY